jgi:hypothetical protein
MGIDGSPEKPMTKRYGQLCPIAKAAEIFCVRWTPAIVRDLAFRASLFSELQRGVPLASPTLLSNRLKQLEREGIVQRRKSASGRSWTYHTGRRRARSNRPFPRDIGPEMVAPRIGETRDRSRTAALDNRARCQAGGFWAGSNRRSIMSHRPDREEAALVVLNESGRCELCLEIPDQNVDLFLDATLPDMIYVCQGDLTLAKALDTRRLRAHGTGTARKAPARWLSISPLAHVRSARAVAQRTNDGQARKLPDFVTESSSAAPWRNTASAFAV